VPGEGETAARPEEVRDRRLLGRSRELAEIRRALADAESGRGRLVLLSGEPGIGKTSLADATTALAEERGFRVLWGRCWESGGAPAYYPWLGVLSTLAQGLDDEALASALGDGSDVLAELVPALRARLPPQSMGAAPPSEQARFRVFRAVVALAREASHRAGRGLLIVLDDLHSADRSSLLLAHFFARELRGSRILLLLTYRDIEAHSDAETSELILRIAREGTLLSLARLERKDAFDFVSGRALGIAERVSDRILERSQGNPLFIEEMLRLLAEQGVDSIDAGVVPHGVRDVIGQRLARVGSEARSLLELAAVAGDEIVASLLGAAAGAPPAHVAAELALATQAGVIIPRGTHHRFAHALFREVLERELSEARRAQLHGLIATALERTSVAGEIPHDKIAHHALHGPPELLERGLDHALRAARRALELFAYDDAVGTLERALAAAENAPPARRASLLLALAEAAIRRGDNDTGRRRCREAASIARDLGDAELGARAALAYGRIFTFANVDPVLVGMLEASLEALPAGDGALKARVLGRLAAALQPSVDVSEPVAVARDAIATARRIGDRQTLLEVLHDSISAMMDCTDPVEARALNLEAEELALELGDRERLLRTHGRMFLLHLSFGELELADRRIDAYEALAAELRAPWLGYRSRLARAIRATMHGRFKDAEKYLEEALRLGTAAGDPFVNGLHASGWEGLNRASERHAELLAPNGMARLERTDYRFAPAWRLLHAGLAHGRREEVEPATATYALLPSAFPRNLFTYFYMVEMLALGGSREQVESLYEEVRSCPEEYLTLGWSYVGWEGPRTRFLALLLGRLGRFDEAEAMFEDALARLEKLEAWPYFTRTEYEYARMLAERGAEGDADRARARFASARERAEALGQRGLLSHIERRLLALTGSEGSSAAPRERASSRPPSVAAARLPPLESSVASPAFTLVLEGDFYSIGFRGRTFRVRTSLGLKYLARLVELPGKEIRALDLVHESQAAPGTSEVIDPGDAGELLDDEARKQYARRVDDLKETLEEAESFGDAGRAERAREELEFLARELGRAVGLGGRVRKAGAAAERARSAVQRRLRHAVDRISEHDPELGKFLDKSINTGNYCVFIPVPD
jgi:tetratricopeptide (TPR) repeat protein